MQQNPSDQAHKIAICTLALNRRAVIRAQYNGSEIELHAHQIVERNDALYLRAVNPAKNRRDDESPALGFFHLGGLSDLLLEGRVFDPLPRESLKPVRPTDRVLESV